MALHAIDDVSDAFRVTRRFLTPFDARRWLKLALVALFVGGGVSSPTVQSNVSSGSEQVPAEELPATIPGDVLGLVVAAVALAVVLALVFGIVGSIMEFVLVESLRSGEVTVRRYWRRRWRQGLRLFGFRVAIGLPVLGLFLAWLALFLGPLVFDAGGQVASVGVFLLGLPVLVLVGVLYALVSGFTTVFVVPLMIQRDSGVLAGWRRLWPSVRSEWQQYLAYAVVSFLLTVGLGFVVSLAVGLGALVVAVPFAIVGAVVYLTLSASSTVGLVLLGLVAVLFALALVVLWALVQVPVVTYLRYYALLVLGDIEPAFDIIPERREAARSGEDPE